MSLELRDICSYGAWGTSLVFEDFLYVLDVSAVLKRLLLCFADTSSVSDISSLIVSKNGETFPIPRVLEDFSTV